MFSFDILWIAYEAYVLEVDVLHHGIHLYLTLFRCPCTIDRRVGIYHEPEHIGLLTIELDVYGVQFPATLDNVAMDTGTEIRTRVEQYLDIAIGIGGHHLIECRHIIFDQYVDLCREMTQAR